MTCAQSLASDAANMIIYLSGISYFADLRMTFRQNFFLQDWFRNKLGVGLGLELVFGIGLVSVKP
jgi:hypothetical protein